MDKKKSREDYLETIYSLSLENKTVRAIDIARDRGFSRPSVSIALKKLISDKLITVSEDGNITLTKTGTQLALQTYDRHLTISQLLLSMGVSKETAYEDACKMEHSVSDETLEKIKIFIGKCHLLSHDDNSPCDCEKTKK